MPAFSANVRTSLPLTVPIVNFVMPSISHCNAAHLFQMAGICNPLQHYSAHCDKYTALSHRLQPFPYRHVLYACVAAHPAVGGRGAAAVKKAGAVRRTGPG